jgi:hypothetical protein
MSWVYWAILAAAALHVVEEYFWPGGFMKAMKGFQPGYARFITTPFALVINGLFLIICLAGALLSGSAPTFSLSIAALTGLNGLAHIGAAVRTRGYAPGVATGVVLYLPLAIAAFFLVNKSGNLSLRSGLTAALLALAFQAVPLGYLGLSRLLMKDGRTTPA